MNKLRENVIYTSVAHPLFAECVHGLVPPPQLVQATISLGPAASRFFSPYFIMLYICNKKQEKQNNLLQLNYKLVY